MPIVRFEGRSVTCRVGERLRDVLLREGLTPHNGSAQWLNCKGFGTCGTCAVRVDGPVSRAGPRERGRLSFPPHTAASGLRLACQAKVLGDVEVTKYEGFWGQDVGQPRGAKPAAPAES